MVGELLRAQAATAVLSCRLHCRFFLFQFSASLPLFFYADWLRHCRCSLSFAVSRALVEADCSRYRKSYSWRSSRRRTGVRRWDSGGSASWSRPCSVPFWEDGLPTVTAGGGSSTLMYPSAF